MASERRCQDAVSYRKSSGVAERDDRQSSIREPQDCNVVQPVSGHDARPDRLAIGQRYLERGRFAETLLAREDVPQLIDDESPAPW